MTITINELECIFLAVINGKISRAGASNRAIELQQASDNKNLNYIPAEKEGLMWDAILFLMGVDLQESPGVYLHDQDYILLELEKLKH